MICRNCEEEVEMIDRSYVMGVFPEHGLLKIEGSLTILMECPECEWFLHHEMDLRELDQYYSTGEKFTKG